MRRNVRKSSDYTGTPNKYPQGFFKPKPCKWCKDEFEPMSPCHMYCGDACKDRAYANSYYKRYYGIGLEKYESLKESQAGKCAICGGEGFRMHKGIKDLLVVDHCHDSGDVRGLLCNNCNRGLGLFKDNKESLANAIKYLEGE